MDLDGETHSASDTELDEIQDQEANEGGDEEQDDGETKGEEDDDDDDDDDEESEPTPLVHRLRPRTRSSLVLDDRQSAVDADGEDTEDDADIESVSSPGPSARLRSRDRMTNSDVSMPSLRQLPEREAKLKALETLQDPDSDDMDVDDALEDRINEDLDDGM